MAKSSLFSNLSGDLFGGLTAGIVALPLALAFGAETELGAQAGLYGSIAVGMLAAIFGGTPTQISGPTAPMTAVSAVVIAETIALVGDFQTALPVIFATFAVAGLIQIGMGLLKLGKYIKFIPYPVISGFMSGIGVIILIGQIFPFFGIASPDGGSLQILKSLRNVASGASWWAVGLAAATVAIIYLAPRITKKVPGALLALILVTLAAVFLVPSDSITSLGDSGANLSELPTLHFGLIGALTDFSYLKIIFQYGFTLAALGSIDSLLTSIVADNVTRTRHDSNRELLGQGIGNIGSAFIGGLPGAGATIRTVVNANAGGRTRLSGVVAALVLLLVLLGLGGLMGYIPNPVLAGILITVGIGIIDYKGLRHLLKVSRADAVVLITVLILTVTVDLLVAVAVGMVLASMLFMKKASEVAEQSAEVGSLSEEVEDKPWADEDEDLLSSIGNRVLIKRVNSSLFFGSVAGFRRKLSNLPDADVLVLRMSRVPYIDQSGLYAIEDSVLELERRGVQVLLTGLQQQPRAALERVDIIPSLISEDHVFEHFREAYLFIEEQYRQGGFRADEILAAPKA